MKGCRWLAALVAVSFLFVPGQVRGSLIDVTYWKLISSANDVGTGAGRDEVTDENVRFPLSESLVAEAGPSRAVGTYDFQATDSQVVFRSDFQQQRGGVRLSTWQYDVAENVVYIRFTAIENAYYTIDGLFTSLGPSTGYMFEWVSLTEAASQYNLFDSYQWGVVEPGQEYRLGEVEGASGILNAGKSYIFSASCSIYPEITDSGSSASGWLLFQVTPEPATVMGSLLLMCLTLVRTRHKTR